MNLTALPILNDNCIWMWGDGVRARVVDLGDAAPGKAAHQARGLQLAGILVTHRLPDHGGSVDALRHPLQGPEMPTALRRWKDPFR